MLWKAGCDCSPCTCVCQGFLVVRVDTCATFTGGDRSVCSGRPCLNGVTRCACTICLPSSGRDKASALPGLLTGLSTELEVVGPTKKLVGWKEYVKRVPPPAPPPTCRDPNSYGYSTDVATCLCFENKASCGC